MKKMWIIALIAVAFLVAGCTTVPTPYNGNDTNTGNSGISIADNNSVINDNNSSGTGVSNLDEMIKVKAGDSIEVHYTGTKKSTGEKFDSSYDRGETLPFVAGTGQMIKGFDAAVIGMKVGDKKTVEIPPAEGYGVIDENNHQYIPKSQLGLDSYEVGQIIIVGQYRLKFYEVNDDNVLASVNHFLAGETLVFDIELMSINK